MENVLEVQDFLGWCGCHSGDPPLGTNIFPESMIFLFPSWDMLGSLEGSLFLSLFLRLFFFLFRHDSEFPDSSFLENDECVFGHFSIFGRYVGYPVLFGGIPCKGIHHFRRGKKAGFWVQEILQLLGAFFSTQFTRRPDTSFPNRKDLTNTFFQQIIHLAIIRTDRFVEDLDLVQLTSLQSATNSSRALQLPMTQLKLGRSSVGLGPAD